MPCTRLRGLVEGTAEGHLLVYNDYVSFYGEIDPHRGVLKPLNAMLKGKILAIRGVRGSTVGPYILYALAKNGLSPAGLIVEHADPLAVASAVLADIPLAECTTGIHRLPEGRAAKLCVTSGGKASLCWDGDSEELGCR